MPVNFNSRTEVLGGRGGGVCEIPPFPKLNPTHSPSLFQIPTSHPPEQKMFKFSIKKKNLSPKKRTYSSLISFMSTDAITKANSNR